MELSTEAFDALEHKPSFQYNNNDPSRVQRQDVLCTVDDPRCACHYGNRNFAELVATSSQTETQSVQHLLTDIDVRKSVATIIVGRVRNSGGHFLGRTTRDTLKQLSFNLSVRWVSWLLKTVANNLMEQQSRVCGDVDSTVVVTSCGEDK